MFFFLACLYSAGTQHRNLHPAGWRTYFILLGLHQEPVLATANTEKNSGEGGRKDCIKKDKRQKGGNVVGKPLDSFETLYEKRLYKKTT